MNNKEKSKMLYENKEFIINAIKNKAESKSSLADKFGVSRQAISRCYTRWTEEPYRQHHEHRDHKPKKSAAKNILMGKEDTDDYFYWLGMLATDGNIHRWTYEGKFVTTPHSRVSLKMTDLDVVEKFKSFCDIPTVNINVQSRSPGRKDVYGYTVNVSEEEADYLGTLGIVPNKTKRLIVRNDLVDNIHFLRGVIDGDGYFGYESKGGGHKRLVVGVATGSEAFAIQLTEAFIRLFGNAKYTIDARGGTTYRVKVVNKEPALSLLSTLYENAPPHIRMERKHQKAMEIIRNYDFVMSP